MRLLLQLSLGTSPPLAGMAMRFGGVCHAVRRVMPCSASWATAPACGSFVRVNAVCRTGGRRECTPRASCPLFHLPSSAMEQHGRARRSAVQCKTSVYIKLEMRFSVLCCEDNSLRPHRWRNHALPHFRPGMSSARASLEQSTQQPRAAIIAWPCSGLLQCEASIVGISH